MMRMHFLGVGSAANTAQHSSAVFEIGDDDRLLIDCGFGTLTQYRKRYGDWPPAAFITHAHLDHIGDLERWFFSAATDTDAPPKLFIPVTIVETIHRRLADYPGQLAEGGFGFWEAFQLIPVGKQFTYCGLSFAVWPARHHAPNSAFALQLPGGFFYTGDTRPIPEVLHHHAMQGEIIFHDAGWNINPSHTGMEELGREYSEDVLRRLWVYHYDQTQFDMRKSNGVNLVRAGMTFELPSGATDTDERRVRRIGGL